MGYPNRGTDPRIFGRIGGRIQQALSWHALTPRVVYGLHHNRWHVAGRIWPPYIGVYVPSPLDINWMWSIRIGWRWDENWKSLAGIGGGYICDVVIKRMDHVVL